MNYLISVIIAIYNSEKFLELCLNSIEAQTIFDQLEVILVNDGSEDRSGDICKSWMNDKKNVIYIEQSNQGVSAARNAGLDIATGNYIGFFDSDDCSSPYMYQHLLEIITEEKCDIANIGIFMMTESEKKYEPCKNCFVKKFSSTESIKNLLTQKYVGNEVCSKLFKRECVSDIRFRKDISIAEDKLFVYQCLKNSNFLVNSSMQLYFYRKHDQSAMNKKFTLKNFDSLKVSNIILEDGTYLSVIGAEDAAYADRVNVIINLLRKIDGFVSIRKKYAGERKVLLGKLKDIPFHKIRKEISRNRLVEYFILVYFSSVHPLFIKIIKRR